MNQLLRIVSNVLKLLMLVASAFFLYALFRLNVLPIHLTIIAVVAIIVIDTMILLLFHAFRKKRVIKMILIVLSIVLMIVYCLTGVYMVKTNNVVETITTTPQTNQQTVSVIVKADSSYQSLEDIQQTNVGIQTNANQMVQMCLQDITNQNITITTQEIEGLTSLVTALETNQVAAIIINESSRDSITEMEEHQNFNTETRVIYQKTYDIENTDQANAVETITQDPFNILITGNDAGGSLQENSRSDVNMIVTVNPSTSTILLTSIVHN